MPQRRVLFLGSARLTACRIDGRKVETEGRFTADEAGLAAFAAYLAGQRNSLFMLLVDVAEEGFQLEEIPFSRGKDRGAIIRRKLGQYFYGTPFALAASQGRVKTGRRDERLLMMALTQPQQLESWLAVLRAANAILAGIYSLPQIIPRLLPADAPEQLLLITQTQSGLRQTFFAGRQLRFSRLTPLATGSDEESSIATVLEAGKMHQYLTSQRLIERNRPLATRVLAHPSHSAALRERCRDSNELRFEIIDLPHEAKRIGMDCHCTDSRAEMLFCHMLAKKPPAEQFAPAAERRFYQLWQIRFGIKAAAAIVLVAGLLFAAREGLRIVQRQADIEQIRQQTLIDQRRYDDTLRSLPKIPLGTDDLRALTERHDQVARRAVGPAPLLAQLSRSLDAFPGIFIERIEWEVAEQIEKPAAGASRAPVPPSMASGPYAQVTAIARLPIGMAGDQRGQLALVADFTKHLGEAPNTLADILQPPVDTQSGKTLKSSEETGTPEAPRFSFRLTRKL